MELESLQLYADMDADSKNEGTEQGTEQGQGLSVLSTERTQQMPDNLHPPKEGWICGLKAYRRVLTTRIY